MDIPTIVKLVLTALGFFSVLSKITPMEWDNEIVNAVQKLIDYIGLNTESMRKNKKK